MVDIVAEIGAKAVAFETADDALTYLLEGHDQCRLVIADHGAPGQIQGIEFIETVRGRWSYIPAILTSGYLIDPATTCINHLSAQALVTGRPGHRGCVPTAA
jgi:CheY-like chemotaxis protein